MKCSDKLFEAVLDHCIYILNHEFGVARVCVLTNTLYFANNNISFRVYTYSNSKNPYIHILGLDYDLNDEQYTRLKLLALGHYKHNEQNLINYLKYEGGYN